MGVKNNLSKSFLYPFLYQTYIIQAPVFRLFSKKDILPCGQFEGLDLAELVARKSGDDLLQGLEGVVEALGALAFPHIGHHPLVAELIRLLRFAGLPLQAPSWLPEGLSAGIRSVQQTPSTAIIRQTGGRHDASIEIAHGTQGIVADVLHVIPIRTGIGTAIQGVGRFIALEALSIGILEVHLGVILLVLLLLLLRLLLLRLLLVVVEWQEDLSLVLRQFLVGKLEMRVWGGAGALDSWTGLGRGHLIHGGGQVIHIDMLLLWLLLMLLMD